MLLEEGVGGEKLVGQVNEEEEKGAGSSEGGLGWEGAELIDPHRSSEILFSNNRSI